ncbi:MAG: ubiquinone biosynthesis protein [Blastocatellia bacterium]|jgi:predicted unusual protein kinase regulating ubiquinone biosynthesis (AarF/ABC1/UbiB family)|nr:ubiquinone biosynthesis protein [Blastocatellia bacterium]
MALSLKPERIKRYKDVVALLIKYGRSDLVQQSDLDIPGEHGQALATTVEPKAEELASDLENLGPTFIKLGQLLSTRGDLLPEPYLDALSRLQDQIEPFGFDEVEEIVSTELGGRISKLFAEFDREPTAAASLAQVHRARMRDGRMVVVKVQRPGVRETIVKDLEALEEITDFIDAHTEMGKRYEFGNMLAELRKSLLRELDFKREAGNLRRLRTSLREFEHIVIPEPVEDYTTSRVLTMDYIAGKKITSLSPLRLMELDGASLAEELFRAYLKQILVDGFFHADPHPGNVFITDDDRIALIDLGMVGHITGSFQENLLRLLLAISEGRGDEAAEVSIKMGEAKPNFDKQDFETRVASLIAEHSGSTVEQIDAGHVALEITRIAANCWFRLPVEFTLIAKALLNLDRVVYTLYPDFDPNEVIRDEATGILTRRIVKSIEPGSVLTRVIEVKEFVERLPTRVNKILDAIGNNELKIDVDAIDERVVLDGLQKVANRITLGLVLAALIVGAALMMRVETSFRIFGYPGLPMIFFLMAAVAGLILIFNIIFYDKHPRKKPGEK